MVGGKGSHLLSREEGTTLLSLWQGNVRCGKERILFVAERGIKNPSKPVVGKSVVWKGEDYVCWPEGGRMLEAGGRERRGVGKRLEGKDPIYYRKGKVQPFDADGGERWGVGDGWREIVERVRENVLNLVAEKGVASRDGRKGMVLFAVKRGMKNTLRSWW